MSAHRASGFGDNSRVPHRGSYREAIQRDWELVTKKIHQTAPKFQSAVNSYRTAKAVSNTHSKKCKRKARWFFPMVGGIGLLGIGGVFLWMATLSIPSLTTFNERKMSNSTTIYDRTGEIILYDVIESAERTAVPFEKISPWMKNAVIAAEDDKFYEHKGVRVDSTIRGATNTLLSKIGLPVSGSGGSTITQQVLKNTILTSDHAITRKIKEWILATKLEQQYTKDQILTMYLNEVPFGGNVYGVEAAARRFFGSNATDLTITQSAYLAAIVNRPTYLSPYGKRLQALEERKNYVLRQMLNHNLITQTEFDTSMAEQVVWVNKKDNRSKAIHFVEYVRSIIERQYGAETMTEGGYKIITTLDWDIQKTAEEASLLRTLEAEKLYNASNSGVIVIEPGSGDILAMVGSRDYEDPAIDGKYNVTLAKRQPGSAFKPIVYAKAFDLGYTPDTVLFDVATQFGQNCAPDTFKTTTDGQCYAPENYDGNHKGPLSLRNALAQSRNIPAVKLLYLVTPPKALQLAKTLGMQSLGSSGLYGLSLVLGGGEVRLLDLTNAYATFGNDGAYAVPHGINIIESKADGKVLYTHVPKTSQVIGSNAVRALNSILSDPDARRPLSGNQLNGFSVPVAAKTGTTNNNRDAWLVGYTPNVAVGVWFGNNDNTPMKKGSSIAIPLWVDVMKIALSKAEKKTPFYPNPPIDPTLPAPLRGIWYGNESFAIDTISGKLATDATPIETRKEVIIPNPHTILAFVQPGNPRAPGGTSSQIYQNWEFGIQKWLAENPASFPDSLPVAPVEYDDVHVVENIPIITPLSDVPSTSIGSDIVIPITLSSTYPVVKLLAYVNDTLVAESNLVTEITIPGPDSTGTYDLRIIAVDSVWNRGQLVTTLFVQ